MNAYAKCLDCQYYQFEEERGPDYYGYCHGRPPVILADLLSERLLERGDLVGVLRGATVRPLVRSDSQACSVFAWEPEALADTIQFDHEAAIEENKHRIARQQNQQQKAEA